MPLAGALYKLRVTVTGVPSHQQTLPRIKKDISKDADLIHFEKKSVMGCIAKAFLLMTRLRKGSIQQYLK